MELNIIHTTRYNYNQPVYLLPHYVRLKPQKRAYLKLTDFELSITPEPMNITERVDAESNPVFQVWMNPEPLKEFRIKAEITVNVEAFDPFHFIIDPPVRFFQNQFHYPEHLKDFLAPFLATSGSGPRSFSSFLNERVKGSDNSSILFLTELLRHIYSNFRYESKEEGVILDADIVYTNRHGSCKELSWMLIEMLRTVGLAARFVSGYAYNPILGDGHELHAWAEVLLPGAGWIGLDPSSGLLTDEHYIPVATSFDPSLTMPVTGSYTGDSSSKLRASVSISEVA